MHIIITWYEHLTSTVNDDLSYSECGLMVQLPQDQVLGLQMDSGLMT